MRWVGWLVSLIVGISVWLAEDWAASKILDAFDATLQTDSLLGLVILAIKVIIAVAFALGILHLFSERSS